MSAAERIDAMRLSWKKVGLTAIQSGRYTISKFILPKEEVRYALYDGERRVGMFATSEAAKAAAG
jgi:hypothetical protein